MPHVSEAFYNHTITFSRHTTVTELSSSSADLTWMAGGHEHHFRNTLVLLVM